MSHELKGKIDFVGALLIIATVVPLLLALTFGGHTAPWTSPLVLGLFGGAALGLALYVVNERFAPDPILPLGLFRNRVFSTANLAGFLVSMSFMSTVAFLPLFMQLGQGVKATTSGLSTLPLMGGLMLSSIVSGRLVTRTGKYKPFMLAGVAVTFIGILLLSRMHASTSRVDLALRMLVLGIGLGPGQSLFSLAIQNAMPPQQLGVVTSSSQFFRQIGSTMGVALFGTFLTNHLNQALGKVMPGIDVGKLQGMAAAAGGAPMQAPPFVKEIVATAITDTFALGLYIVVVAVLVVLLIPQLPMRDMAAMRAEMAKAPGEGDPPVIPAEAHL
jgi:MFS family permease